MRNTHRTAVNPGKRRPAVKCEAKALEGHVETIGGGHFATHSQVELYFGCLSLGNLG